jgi:hypothetical protein
MLDARVDISRRSGEPTSASCLTAPTNAHQFALLRIISRSFADRSCCLLSFPRPGIRKVTGEAKFTCSPDGSIIQLSLAKAARMSNLPAETAEPGGAVKSCPTVEAAARMETGEAVEATRAKSEAGEPTEGIAVTKLGPIVVSWPSIVVIVAAARSGTAIARGERVAGWTDRNQSGGARRRSA